MVIVLAIAQALRSAGFSDVDFVMPDQLDVAGVLAVADEFHPDVALVDLNLGVDRSGLPIIGPLVGWGVAVVAFSAKNEELVIARSEFAHVRPALRQVSAQNEHPYDHRSHEERRSPPRWYQGAQRRLLPDGLAAYREVLNAAMGLTASPEACATDRQDGTDGKDLTDGSGRLVEEGRGYERSLQASHRPGESPRRMTLDLDDARFEWLRREAYDSRVPAAELLRAAIALMQDDAELRRLIVESAETFYGQYDWIRPAASAR